MKCVLILSPLPDILFIHADKAFTKHINKISLEAGFISEEHDCDTINMTAVSHVFSPMITSLTYMNDLGNPYSSILCEDGTIFAFSQVSGILLLSFFLKIFYLPIFFSFFFYFTCQLGTTWECKGLNYPLLTLSLPSVTYRFYFV